MNPGLCLPCLFNPFSGSEPSGMWGLILCQLDRLRVTPGTSGPFVGVSVAWSGNSGRDWVSRWVEMPPSVGGHQPSGRGCESIRTAVEGSCSLLEHLLLPWDNRACIPGLRLGPESHPSPPRPPACRQQMVEPLGLHSPVSQSLINLSLCLSVQPSFLFCSPGDPGLLMRRVCDLCCPLAPGEFQAVSTEENLQKKKQIPFVWGLEFYRLTRPGATVVWDLLAFVSLSSCTLLWQLCLSWALSHVGHASESPWRAVFLESRLFRLTKTPLPDGCKEKRWTVLCLPFFSAVCGSQECPSILPSTQNQTLPLFLHLLILGPLSFWGSLLHTHIFLLFSLFTLNVLLAWQLAF